MARFVESNWSLSVCSWPACDDNRESRTGTVIRLRDRIPGGMSTVCGNGGGGVISSLAGGGV